MNARYLFVFCGLLLLFVNGAYGDGTYQRTKDGSTLVWNNDPRIGDAATWSGNRDKDGYAQGKGTLTWYRTEQVHVTGSNIRSVKHMAGSRYSGKMVRGKLDGQVAAVDAKGNTFHVTFVNGKASDWAVGRAPSRKQRRDEPDQQDAVVEAPAPAEGPVQRSEVRGQRSELTDQVVSEHVSDRAVADKRTAPVDDSLRSLISPPSLIRMTRVAEPPAPNATDEPGAPPPGPTTSAASSPAARPGLTTAEVIALADAEARTQGYDLGEYQRPQAHYTAADDTWSVSYDQKYIDGMGAIGKHFSVNVADKTKKTAITLKH